MSKLRTVTRQEALDIVESLPERQQDELVNIIRRRHLERRRESLVENIEEARAEFARGEFRRGSVDDLMREVDECADAE